MLTYMPWFFSILLPFQVLLAHSWVRPLSHLASVTASLPAVPYPFSLPPPKRFTLRYKHSCDCVTTAVIVWLPAPRQHLPHCLWNSTYISLHGAQGSSGPPNFLVISPFTVSCTWGDCTHNSPPKSHGAFPGLYLWPLMATLPFRPPSPHPNNTHSSELREAVPSSMAHSPVPSQLGIISWLGAPTVFHFFIL